MRTNIRRLICIVGILTFAIQLSLPYNALAEDAGNEESIVKPNIVIQTKDWLVITYGEKVADKFMAAQQLNGFVMNEQAKMWQHFTGIAGGAILDGSNYWIRYGNQIIFGNSYVQTNWGTFGNWSGGSAGFGGWSSSAWYGTVPAYNCDVIVVEHNLTPVYGCEITECPSGWDVFWGCATSGTLTQENT